MDFKSALSQTARIETRYLMTVRGRRLLMLALVCIVFGVDRVSGTPDDLPPPASDSTFAIDDSPPADQMPYGTATTYLIGVSLVEQGELREGLSYLHQAYRMAPEEKSIALAYCDVLLALGYRSDALPLLEQLVEQQPNDIELRHRLAAVLADLKQFDRALAELQKLGVAGREDPNVLLLEAGILARTGQTDTALELYRLALERFPERSEPLYLMMASELDRTDRTEDLESLLREAVAAMPRSRALRLALMHVLVLDDRRDEARQLALEADRLNTEARTDLADGDEQSGPSYLVELADMLVRQEQFGAAVQILQEQFSAANLDLNGSLWLARLLLGSGRVEEGLALMPQIARRWPESGRVHYLWGRGLAAQDQLDEALVHLRQAVELAPGDGEIRTALVRMLLIYDQHQQSIGVSQQERNSTHAELKQHAKAAASLIGNQDYEGQLVLGYAFATLEDFERASDRFSRAWEDRALRLDAGIQLSLCEDKLGRTARVRDIFQQLRREFPDDPDLANTFGYWLAERGEDLDLAEQMIRAALDAEPGNGAFLDSLGWVYYQREKYAESFDLLVKAVNARPDDPVILEHLGLVLKASGRPTEAIAMLRRSLAAGGDAERLEPLIEELASEVER